MSDHSNAMNVEPVLNLRELKKMAIKALALSSGEKHLYIDSRRNCLFSNTPINYSKMLSFFGLGHCGILLADYQVFRIQERGDDNNSNEGVFCFQVEDNENVWIDMVFDLDRVKVVIV